MRFSKALGAAFLTLVCSASSVSITAGATDPVNGAKSAAASQQYDGKPFAVWRDYLFSELKAERRIDALAAMAAFGSNGRGREAAAAIVEFIKKAGKDIQSDGDMGRKVLEKATWAFGRIGEESAPVLFESLKDSNEYVQRFSQETLSNSTVTYPEFLLVPFPKTLFPVVIQMIEGREPRVRDATIAILTSRFFLAEARMEESPDRARLMATIEKRKDTGELVAALVRALNEGNGEARSSAPVILGLLGSRGKAAVPALVKKLKERDRDSDLDPSGVARALGNIGCEPERIVPVLIEALGAPGLAWNNTLDEWAERSLRRAAATALGQFGVHSKAAVPKLLKAVIPGQREIAAEAIEALCKIGIEADQFVPVLVKAFRRSKDDFNDELFEERRLKIVQALGHVGPAAKEALPILNEALQASSSDLRHAAAVAVKKINEN
jgi:HEAT repeat protein